MLRMIITGLSFATITSLAFAANPLAKNPSDPQIVKTLMNTNDGEIAMAKLAQQKATHPQVKKFAEEMIKGHTKNNQEATELTQSAKMEPAASMKSEAKTLKAQKNLAMLKMKEGTEFDKAYIDGQVSAHKQVLEELRGSLIPSAKNSELKTMLEDTAKDVQEHLEQAQKIQRELINGQGRI